MQNYHCSVLQINETGLLIQGPSGFGKTSLMLGLLDFYASKSKAVHLVCDDQALLRVEGDSIIAEAPTAIEGKVELYGYGIVVYPFKKRSKIDLVVNIVDQSNLERMPEPMSTIIMGVEISSFNVPKQHEAQSIRIINAKLTEMQ